MLGSDRQQVPPAAHRLAQETKLLQTIDKLRLAAAGPNREARTQAALTAMAAPKQWALANGVCVEVETPGTLRCGHGQVPSAKRWAGGSE